MNWQKLRKGLTDPPAALREINKLFYTRARTRSYYPHGTDVFAAEDWDNLVILDACRYDEFARQTSLHGRLEYRLSRGATSSEFVRGNFGGKTLYDVVYVSANEWYEKLREEIGADVHRFVNLQRDHLDYGGVSVRPETVTEQALEIAEEYPKKRLVVHYLQPHQPYLGPTGQDQFVVSPGLIETIRRSENVTDDLLRQAYRENLDLVLGCAETLIEGLPGKTVVTADHGELLGERVPPCYLKTYGHFDGIYVDKLLKVPWFVCEYDERKEIVAERPNQRLETTDETTINERLRRLGYKV